jgi:hypothetical protein
MSGNVTAQLEVLAYYLVARRAPVASSPLEPDHFDSIEFREAWRLARGNPVWSWGDLGFSPAAAGAIDDASKRCPRNPRDLRQAESRVLSAWGLRTVWEAAESVLARRESHRPLTLADLTEPLREAISTAEAGTLEVSEPAKATRARMVSETARRWDDPHARAVIPHGIQCLRESQHGWYRPGTHYLAANTGEHKTTWMRTDAAYAARNGFRGLFWPCEGRPDDMEIRDVAQHTTLTTTDLYRDKHPGDMAVQQLVSAADKAPGGLRYVTRPSPTLEHVVSVLRRECATRRLDVAYIDHVHRLRGGDSPDYWDRVGNTLDELSIELDIAIVCSAQFNQKAMGEVNMGRTPNAADIQHGGRLARNSISTYVMNEVRVPRDHQDNPRDRDEQLVMKLRSQGRKLMRISCEKNRKGKKGTWFVEMEPAHDRFGREVLP